jgi:hypothetical protein
MALGSTGRSELGEQDEPEIFVEAPPSFSSEGMFDLRNKLGNLLWEMEDRFKGFEGRVAVVVVDPRADHAPEQLGNCNHVFYFEFERGEVRFLGTRE